MPTTNSNLTTFSDLAGVGTEIWGTNLPGAGASDNSYVELNPVPVITYTTHYLKGVQLVSPPAVGAGTLTELRVLVEIKDSDPASGDMVFARLRLFKGGSVLDTVDKAAATAITGSDVVYTFTFTGANLATLGVVTADLDDADFGCVMAVTYTLTDISVGLPFVDHMYISYDLTLGSLGVGAFSAFSLSRGGTQVGG